MPLPGAGSTAPLAYALAKRALARAYQLRALAPLTSVLEEDATVPNQ